MTQTDFDQIGSSPVRTTILKPLLVKTSVDKRVLVNGRDVFVVKHATHAEFFSMNGEYLGWSGIEVVKKCLINS